MSTPLKLKLASDIPLAVGKSGNVEGTIGAQTFETDEIKVRSHNGRVEITAIDRLENGLKKVVDINFLDSYQQNTDLELSAERSLDVWISDNTIAPPVPTQCREGKVRIKKLIRSPLTVEGTINATAENGEAVNLTFKVGS